MILTTIILLIVIGVLLIILDVLLLPDILVARVLSVVAFVASVVVAYAYYDIQEAVWVLFLDIALILITVLLSKQQRSSRIITPNDTIGSEVVEVIDIEIGSEAIAFTPLTPLGSVVIDGNIYEAKSIDGDIDAKSIVYVEAIDNGIILVKA